MEKLSTNEPFDLVQREERLAAYNYASRRDNGDGPGRPD